MMTELNCATDAIRIDHQDPSSKVFDVTVMGINFVMPKAHSGNDLAELSDTTGKQIGRSPGVN